LRNFQKVYFSLCSPSQTQGQRRVKWRLGKRVVTKKDSHVGKLMQAEFGSVHLLTCRVWLHPFFSCVGAIAIATNRLEKDFSFAGMHFLIRPTKVAGDFITDHFWSEKGKLRSFLSSVAP
jgi:hypothetical protein